MSRHPYQVEDFESFLRKPTEPRGAARNTHLVRHLLRGCAPCRESLAAAVAKQTHYEYGRAFTGAESSLTDFLAQAPPAAAPPDVLFAELSELPPAEQATAAAADRRYAHPDLVRYLIDAGHAVRYQDPFRMLHLSDLARALAEACTAETAGNAAKLEDLRAQAWRQYGNSLRILGRLREADDALTIALGHLEAGTRDPLLRARLCSQTASLRYFQRRFGQAIEQAEEAGRIYEELGDTHAFASTLVQKAIASLYAGDAEEAVRILNQAIPLIEADGDPHLLMAACHNLVRCYIDMGRPEQALSIYSETQNLYQGFRDPLIRLRIDWQEGQLLRDLGHLRAAETALLKARQGFEERELLYEAAQISLDLAAVYVKLQAEQELRQTVEETVPIFRALGVDREVLASLLQLRQLAHQSRQALELIHFLNTRIEQLTPHQASH